MRHQRAKGREDLYYFKDNWNGDIHHFDTFSEARKAAEKNTFGHPILIFRQGEIVKVVPPKERPLS